MWIGEPANRDCFLCDSGKFLHYTKAIAGEERGKMRRCCDGGLTLGSFGRKLEILPYGFFILGWIECID